MKTFAHHGHHWVAPVCRWIGLCLVLCFFTAGLANAVNCADPPLRLKSSGISKAQPSRTGGSSKVKVDHPIVAVVASHPFAEPYPAAAWRGYGSQRPFIASLRLNPLSNKAPPIS